MEGKYYVFGSISYMAVPVTIVSVLHNWLPTPTKSIVYLHLQIMLSHYRTSVTSNLDEISKCMLFLFHSCYCCHNKATPDSCFACASWEFRKQASLKQISLPTEVQILCVCTSHRHMNTESSLKINSSNFVKISWSVSVMMIHFLKGFGHSLHMALASKKSEQTWHL